jgi:hypothetical protein
MPLERRKQMGDHAEATWDTLPDRDKAIILGSSSPYDQSRIQRKRAVGTC